jgi:hypothetical protein
VDAEFVWPFPADANAWAAARPGVEIVPLYRHPQQPALSDEEREAIAESIWHWLRQADALLAVEREARIAASSRAATLQGLRERLEGRRE